MNNFLTIFAHAFYKFIVWSHGVRFYQSKRAEENLSVHRVVFEQVNDQKIEFKFFREEHKDTVYRFGRFRTVEKSVIVVHSTFGIGDDHPILKFDDTRFTFLGRWYGFDDETICRVLLGIYLSHVQKNV